MPQFAMPNVSRVNGAIVIALGTPEIETDLNLLILLTQPGTINWELVTEIRNNPMMPYQTLSLSSNPWVYRCCSYSVGIILGMIEGLSKKRFVKSVIPEELAGVTTYELLGTQKEHLD